MWISGYLAVKTESAVDTSRWLNTCVDPKRSVPLTSPRKLRDIFFAKFELPQGVAQVLEKTMARLRQSNRACMTTGALEQSSPEILFQLLYVDGQRGL
jgi:hypothetical protein